VKDERINSLVSATGQGAPVNSFRPMRLLLERHPRDSFMQQLGANVS
jgi:hypothetical protein